jgi:hypothetical protein
MPTPGAGSCAGTIERLEDCLCIGCRVCGAARDRYRGLAVLDVRKGHAHLWRHRGVLGIGEKHVHCIEPTQSEALMRLRTTVRSALVAAALGPAGALIFGIPLLFIGPYRLLFVNSGFHICQNRK